MPTPDPSTGTLVYLVGAASSVTDELHLVLFAVVAVGFVVAFLLAGLLVVTAGVRHS